MGRHFNCRDSIQTITVMNENPGQYFFEDDGIFPNSQLPVLMYRQAIQLPKWFAASKVKKLLQSNGWSNNWKQGIYTFSHYHSITHEIVVVCKGELHLLIGGTHGKIFTLHKGDAIAIPAGIAHKNVGKENDATCVGGYPEGRNFDINKGLPGERPTTDYNIQRVPIPATDPFTGTKTLLPAIWEGVGRKELHY